MRSSSESGLIFTCLIPFIVIAPIGSFVHRPVINNMRSVESSAQRIENHFRNMTTCSGVVSESSNASTGSLTSMRQHQTYQSFCTHFTNMPLLGDRSNAVKSLF